jgi:hypothetical protein
LLKRKSGVFLHPLKAGEKIRGAGEIKKRENFYQGKGKNSTFANPQKGVKRSLKEREMNSSYLEQGKRRRN